MKPNDVTEEVAGVVDDTTIVEQISSILDDIGEMDEVTVFNPLTITFQGKFSRTIPADSPLNKENRRVSELSGIDLRKGEGAGGVAHVASYVKIPAGQSLKMHGYAAKVVARQLVTDIIQRQGRKGQIADPKVRREVEEMVILGTKNTDSGILENPRDSFEREMKKLNDPLTNAKDESHERVEQSFPDVTEKPAEVHTKETRIPGESGAGHNSGGEPTPIVKKPAGRSKAKA